MTGTYDLASLPQQTLNRWHDFVASGDSAKLSPLLAQAVVFRSPFVQMPIPGHAATHPAGAQHCRADFREFRYHRTFVGGSHDVALEFGANVEQWELKGVDLIHFNNAGEMIDFEVMIRPMKALQAVGEAMGSRIGPQLAN